MKKIILKTNFFLFLFLFNCRVFAQSGNREIRITDRYLNLPVGENTEGQEMIFSIGSKAVRTFKIRLSLGHPDYWVFADVSAYKGQALTIHYPSAVAGLDRIYQSHRINGADSLYKETNRPRFHFTTQRGWNNDPNGLIYYKGVYHLFYQYNPYEINWGNMTWGHAVSRDLLHWKELSPALYPDASGDMFSGSAAIDSNNTSGFQTGKEKVLVAAYTAHRNNLETQNIAFSNDGGFTWTKYAGNPVVNSKAKWDNSPDTRDPVIFWFNPIGKWVMTLYEKDGNSIYNSDNLKEWVYQSHVPGFSECPQLLQLPVDKDTSHKKWIMTDASGVYLTGDFDGHIFKPDGGKKTYFSGEMYAAQTFNNIPASDGRHIQIGWGKITHPGMPFNQMMTFPTDLTLRTVGDKIRLFSEPIAEIASLHNKAYNWSSPSIADLNKQLEIVNGEQFHMKVDLSGGSASSILLDGNTLIDTTAQRELNQALYGGDQSNHDSLILEILVDRTSVEIFADHGRFGMIEQRELPKQDKKGIQISETPGLVIDRLELFEMKSIWQ